ncbi:beta-amyrin 28-monooxygenase [Ranunculus cassubicifolius]
MLLFFTLVSLVLFLIFFFFMTRIHKLKHQFPNLPPGSMGWPIVGENLEFLASSLSGTPESFIQNRVKKYSSQIFKTSIVGQKVVFFCGPAANKFVFYNQNTLFRSWWPTAMVRIFPTRLSFDEENKKIRTILPTFLKSDSIRRYVSIMHGMTKTHLKMHWEGKDEVLALPLVMKYTFTMGCRLLASVEDDSLMKKLEGRTEVVSIGSLCFPYKITGFPLHNSIVSSKFVRDEFLKIIKKRKSELIEGKVLPTQDILSTILTAKGEDGNMWFPDENDIASLIFILLTASYYTTTTTLTFLMSYLAENPYVYDRVLKEQEEIAQMKTDGEELKMEDLQKMKYSWNVVCEVLRLVPSLQGSFREVITDFSYAGFSIPKGFRVLWNAYSTHMDPKWFPEPKKFDPSRFEGDGPAPYTWVAFGGGSQMCPGINYARCQILVFIHHIVRKFKWEKLLQDERTILDPLPQPEKGCPIRLHRHLHSL